MKPRLGITFWRLDRTRKKASWSEYCRLDMRKARTTDADRLTPDLTHPRWGECCSGAGATFPLEAGAGDSLTCYRLCALLGNGCPLGTKNLQNREGIHMIEVPTGLKGGYQLPKIIRNYLKCI